MVDRGLLGMAAYEFHRRGLLQRRQEGGARYRFFGSRLTCFQVSLLAIASWAFLPQFTWCVVGIVRGGQRGEPQPLRYALRISLVLGAGASGYAIGSQRCAS